ncbi:helical backbone metal receptor [Flavobacteriaceae bacterium 3-367]
MGTQLKDQLGRKLILTRSPTRIISLVPSQTELLVALGLEEAIVGLTKFCVHPAHLIQQKKVVGGTKNISYKKIGALQPHIVLCNKEENTKEIVAELEKEYPVYVSDVATVEDSLEMIAHFGQLFGCAERAAALITKINGQVAEFKEFVKGKPKLRVLYLIWKNPWMTIGKDTFIHSLLTLNGFTNAFANQTRYPEIDEQTFQSVPADVIFLSSEPYPFREKHRAEARQLRPQAKICLVDGEYFSWHGSRLADAFSYFKELHAELANS